MQNLFLSILLASELSFYLLIVQTGVVEYFHSNLTSFWTLPLGGIIGAMLSYKNFFQIDTINKKLTLALSLQLFISLFYPNFTLILLFLLGISVGVIAPILIILFVNKRVIYALLGLALAYTIGTLLFNFDVTKRDTLSILFSMIALFASLYLKDTNENRSYIVDYSSIGVLFLWIVLDSSLFEILSRSENISIWRSEYSPLIVIFHLIGLMVAYLYREKEFNDNLITILFGFSYLFFYLEEPILLSIVYPFVISYYNFFMFSRLIKIGNLKALGAITLFTCWMASGVGLMIALFDLTYLPILFLILLGSLNFKFIIRREYA